METEFIKENNIQVSEIRDVLTEDFSPDEINRIMMVLKTKSNPKEINLNNIRLILQGYFSDEFINRAIMTLKISSS